MKKAFCFAALFFLLVPSAASAQPLESRNSRIHLGFFPPISSNGRLASEFTNNFSLHVLAGVSRNERGAALAGLANLVENDAGGAMFAGLYNRIGNDGKGAVFAGLLNMSNNYAGTQFAGLENIVWGDLTGVSFAGLMNMSNRMQGAQLAGLLNMSDNMQGVQLAGLLNMSGDVRGVQAAGLLNMAMDVESGVQAAGLGNVAVDVRGSQLAGLFNYGQIVDGVQVAGLVNIAASSRASIALINILRDGEMGIGLTINEIGNTTATFRSGGDVFYGILGGGYNFRFGRGAAVLEAGFGARIYLCPRLRINNELKTTYVGKFNPGEIHHHSFNLLPAFRITPKWEIFGGPSINYMYSDNPGFLEDFPSGTLWKKTGENYIRQLHIGFSAGIYFRL